MDSIEKQFQDILQDISKQISGTIGISIVELESGMALSTLSNQPEFNLEIAAAYNAEVVKQKMKAMAALNLKNQEINEFIISLTSQIHIIRFINAKYILYFAVDSTTSNLALIKVVLNSCSSRLKNIIDVL